MPGARWASACAPGGEKDGKMLSDMVPLPLLLLNGTDGSTIALTTILCSKKT